MSKGRLIRGPISLSTSRSPIEDKAKLWMDWSNKGTLTSKKRNTLQGKFLPPDQPPRVKIHLLMSVS